MCVFLGWNAMDVSCTDELTFVDTVLLTGEITFAEGRRTVFTFDILLQTFWSAKYPNSTCWEFASKSVR